MKILVVLEHEKGRVRGGSLAALGFAHVLRREQGGTIAGLLLGEAIDEAARHAARFAPVLVADSPGLRHPLAEGHAGVIARAAREGGFDLITAAATTYAKDVVGRAAGLMGGAMAGDVVGHEVAEGQLLFRRPMYAGSLVATVRVTGRPLVVTVRPTAYAGASASDRPHPVTKLEIDEIDEARWSDRVVWEGVESQARERPDLSEARVVVSGGRAFRSTEEFERYVGGLADALGGAAGSTRALVDAGITPNELQVGQTGKIVAPALYIALGLSGAVQHMAGMKNSKVIVAINTDAQAPIVEMADYALIGDVREVVPQLIAALGKTL